MSAVAYRVRCGLRVHWRTTLALGLVVAAVTGVVLALAAGAARTASAPDRYTAAWVGRFDGTVEQGAGRPRVAEVAALPGVAAVEALTFVFGGLVPPDGGPPRESLVFAGTHRAFAMEVVAGRGPDPTRPEEFVATRSFADRAGVEVGASFNLLTLSQEQADRSGYESFFSEGPQGPSAEVLLVGLIDGPDQLNDPSPISVVHSSVVERGAAVASTTMSVRLRPGNDLAAFRAQLDTLPGGDALSLEPAELVSSEVRTAVEGQALGLWVLTGVAAVTAAVVLGQLLTRTVRLTAEEGPLLKALGFRGAQVLAESAARAAVPIAAGTAMGVPLATALSPIFPVGFVRRLEHDPGLRPDPIVLAAGAACAVVALLIWTVTALLLARRPGSPDRPSKVVEWVATHSPSAPMSTGFRFAFAASRRDRSSVRATVAGILATTAILIGAVVFGSNLARLVTDPARFGNNFDLLFGSGGEGVPEEVVTDLTADPDIVGVMLYAVGQARVGAVTLGLAGMGPVKGASTPVVLSGRLPVAEDEIALGRLAARSLGAREGSDLTLDAGGRTLRFRVTGLAVVPPVQGLDGVGEDAVVTLGGLARIDDGVQPSAVAINARRGALAKTAERLGLGPNSTPYVITNLTRVRAIPFLVAGVVGALSVLTVVHVMLTSVHRRRREVAVLRSLGADASFVTRAVHWQATMFSLLPLALGAPLGLAAGRLVFAAFTERLGTLPSVSFPYASLGILIAAFIVLANLVAAVPAYRARRLAPAPLLTPE